MSILNILKSQKRRNRDIEEARQAWDDHCKTVKAGTALDQKKETPSQKQARINRLLNCYEEFVAYYFPHLATCPNADYHNEWAKLIRDNKQLYLVIIAYRAGGKTIHLGLFNLILLMLLGESRYILIVCVTAEVAEEYIGNIQAELMENQRLIDDFGEMYGHGTWEKRKIVTKAGVTFRGIGKGQKPRGARKGKDRVDTILVSDIDEDKEVLNESLVEERVEWLESAVMETMDIGNQRYIQEGNLIHDKSILALMAAKPGFIVRQVNAVVDEVTYRPTWPQKYTAAYWKEKAERKGLSFQREQMNKPFRKGKVFKNEWIRWLKMPKSEWYKYHQIVGYIDPSWSSSPTSDFKAIRVWGLLVKDHYSSPEYHLLDCYVRRGPMKHAVSWLFDFHASLPSNVAPLYYMEGIFYQHSLLSDFYAEEYERGFHIPLTADLRSKPNKDTRIQSLEPWYSRGLVFYNELNRETEDFRTSLQHVLAYGPGASVSDDALDADEGAFHKLKFQPISKGSFTYQFEDDSRLAQH